MDKKSIFNFVLAVLEYEQMKSRLEELEKDSIYSFRKRLSSLKHAMDLLQLKDISLEANEVLLNMG